MLVAETRTLYRVGVRSSLLVACTLLACGCGRALYDAQEPSETGVLDGFSPDAGAPEAGTLDAAPEAGALDAAPEAGTLDAALDAGTSEDAHAIDARDSDAGFRVGTLVAETPTTNANLGDEVASDGTRFAIVAEQGGGRIVVLGPAVTGWERELDSAPHSTTLPGFSPAISGSDLFVGAYQAGVGGLVERWRREEGTWSWVENLTADDAEAGDLFGIHVESCEGRLFVGAPGHSGPGDPDDSGRVLVFEGARWTRSATFEPPIAEGQSFGRHFACGGPRLMVLNGRVLQDYVFDGTSWVVETQLALRAGEYACDFTLDGTGTWLAIGYCGDPGERQQGRVQVLRHESGGWRLHSDLVTSPRLDGSGFGQSLALRDDVLLVGAAGFNTAGGTLDGAVHQLRRIEDRWELIEIVYPEVGSAGRFGYSVAIAGRHGAAGAPWTEVDGLSRAGAFGLWPLR